MTKETTESITFRLELVEIEKIIPNPKNSRYITEKKKERLSYSMGKYKLHDRPIVNEKDKDGNYLLLAGHKRLEIEKENGHSQIYVQIPERPLTQEEFDELSLLHNNASGEYDFEELQTHFDIDYLIEVGGFEMYQFSFQIEDDEAEEDDYQVPEKIETDIKKGDLFVFQKGDLTHKLLCGDSQDEKEVSRLLDGYTPDLMVTDPPYGVSYDPEWRNKAGVNKSKGRIGKVKNDDTPEWTRAYELSNAPVAYIWHAGKYTSTVLENLKSVGYLPISQIIWKKDQFVLSRGDYHWQHEPCWYVHKKGKKHNWQGARDQSTIWEIAKVDRNEDAYGHGTQKPIECMARPIRNNSKKGEIVYDPFLGSGTTMVAAHQMQRNCYGIDLDEKWCQVIVDRMIALDPEIKVFRNMKPYKK